MNEHAGMGCALSGLIVVVFALIFYEKERPVVVANTTSEISIQPQAPSTTKPTVLQPTLSNPPVEAEVIRIEPNLTSNSPTPKSETPILVQVDPPAPASSFVSIKPESRPSVIAPATPQTMVAHIISTPPRPLTPRSTITIIGKGERLVDVAIRIYGSAEATAKLLRANRDRLTSVDDPVSAGWMLRTP